MDREKTLETLMEWFDAGMIMYENLPKLADEICNQWISVEDRLPGKGCYLCWHIAWDGPSDAYFDGLDKFFDYEVHNAGDEVVVSHWQKLPAPPEDARNET